MIRSPGKRNPGDFDYRKYLEIQNIHKLFYVNDYKNVTVLSKDNLNYFYQNILIPVKIFVLTTIDKNYDGDEAAYLKGLITGERSDITQEMKDDFVNAGVMHLIAVSGLNVAYIIISLSLILSLLRFPMIPRAVITIAFLIFYCMFTGNTASIVRASIMGILVLIAILLERRINFYNIIGMAAMMILIYDAKQLFDPGFILSFSAVLSMAVFLTTFEKVFLSRIRELHIKGKKIALMLLALFFTSLAAQIGTIPITANYFGKISVISLLTNIIAVPLANLSLAIGFFQMFIAAISEYLSSVISETNNVLLYVQLSFIQWCASPDFAYFSVENFNFTSIIAYYLIVLILIWRKTEGNFCFRIILSGLILCGYFILETDLEKKLKITFLDVGQGDCSVIHTPDDKIILVDCGRTSFVSNSGERIIAPYLKRNSVSRIDLLIITHLHLDHIGGIHYLLENFEIGKIIESGQKYNTAFTNTMDSLIQAKKIPRETIRTGDYINNIENLRLYFIFPGAEFVDQTGNTLNNNLNNGSVAFILKYKENEFFFSGDIEKESENFISDTYTGFIETDVLKVAHHGSITSSTIKFIVNNKPQHAVISCGMYNKFNHPSDLVLNRLNNIGAVIHRTDTEGAVVFQSDGRNIEIIDW
ncbi:MAG: DNA internalization-related competence protein ComEC/Rec2 [Ignavibacteria bacterium]|nr:DNA internalization-related competence protein ComEC/Rec2 [Ignavibacteria bacterium]